MPAAYERCVEHVRGRKDVKNPHAVCTAKNAGNVKQYRRRKAKRRLATRSMR